MSLDSILRSIGKNLFNKSTLTAGTKVVELTQTTNGFTFKTSATLKTMQVGSNIYLIAGTYYCSGTVTCSDTSYKGGWGVYDKENQKYIINASSRGTINDKFTVTESKTYHLGFFAPYNAPVGVTMTFENIQLEQGSTATSYEPYQQGPKTIKIPYRGNNIITYPYENTTQTINGVTFTVGKDGSITINGTPTDTTKFDVKNSITLEQNKQYTLSGFKERPEGSAGAVFHLDPIDGMSQNITIDSQYQTQTFTADSSNYYCYIIVPTTGDLVDNIVFYPQLEEGTVATEFSLNTGDKEVLKVSYGSRNLWQNTNTTFPSTLSYDNSTQTYTMDTGTAGYAFAAHTLTNPIPAGTTVTISVIFQSGKGTGTAIGGYHSTGGTSWQGHITVPEDTDMTGQTLTSTFTTTETVEAFVIFHNTGSNIEVPYIFKVQYELGDKATEYVPYSKEVVWTK